MLGEHVLVVGADCALDHAVSNIFLCLSNLLKSLVVSNENHPNWRTVGDYSHDGDANRTLECRWLLPNLCACIDTSYSGREKESHEL